LEAPDPWLENQNPWEVSLPRIFVGLRVLTLTLVASSWCHLRNSFLRQCWTSPWR